MGVRIDTRTVLRAGAVAFSVGLLANLAFELADNVFGFGPDSNWVFAFALISFTGSAIGGVIAGRSRPTTPLTHGALAALAAHGANAVIIVVVRAVGSGDELGRLVVTLILLAPLPVAISAFSAYLASRSAPR